MLTNSMNQSSQFALVGALPQSHRGILGRTLGMTFMMQAAETITTRLCCRKTLHAQKVVDIATGSGSKTTLRPL